MPIEGEYEPSSWAWVSKQVDQIESSGGTKGLTLQGKPVVVVTMRGRKSGKVRKAALMKVEHDGRYAIVASKGGDPEHPGGYHNIVADPDVSLQDGTVVQDMRARRGRRRRADRVVGSGGRGLAGVRRLPDQDRPSHPRLRARAGRLNRGAGRPRG